MRPPDGLGPYRVVRPGGRSVAAVAAGLPAAHPAMDSVPDLPADGAIPVGLRDGGVVNCTCVNRWLVSMHRTPLRVLDITDCKRCAALRQSGLCLLPPAEVGSFFREGGCTGQGGIAASQQVKPWLR